MKKVLKDYLFGFDLVNVKKVMSYLENNYVSESDFKMWIERGEDVMNGLEVFNKDLVEDEKFLSLVYDCDGEGKFELERDDVDEYVED
jgi:hypothetical protein